MVVQLRGMVTHRTHTSKVRYTVATEIVNFILKNDRNENSTQSVPTTLKRGVRVYDRE